VLFDVLSSLGVGVFKLKGMNWPTLQFFYCKTILGVPEKHVCSLVYKFEGCGRGRAGSAVRIVPNVREIAALSENP
jgi:hypothetical protein